MKSTRYLIALLLLAALIVACTQAPTKLPGNPTVTGTYTPVEVFNPEDNVEATSFGSEEEFLAFLQSSGGFDYGGVGLARGTMLNDFDAAAPQAAVAESSKSSGGSAQYSGTNNQVANVDEADIIKTDGKYIYTITGQTLFIINAFPGDEAEIVNTIDFENSLSGVFVSGDHLAVFGNFYDLDYFKEIGYIPRRGGMMFFNIYDISDRENPQLLKEYKFEGAYFQARLYNDHVYFVTTTFPDGRGEYPTPIIMEGDTVRSMPVSDIYYFPVPYDSIQLATVHSVNLADPSDAISSKALAVEWDNKLYMSENNIYITHTEHINEWELRQEVMMDLIESQLTAEDRALIEKIRSTDDDVLSQPEKKQKIWQVYASYSDYLPSDEQTEFQKEVDSRVSEILEEYKSMSYTIINRLSVEDGEVTVEATGKVPGSLNNQFSMDEHDGVLRVATTIQPFWNRWVGPPIPIEPAVAEDVIVVAKEEIERRIAPVERTQTTNNVYALDASLNIIGELEGLAAGEQIYSTRFIGDKLYMVTFRQVDPFFVIDLSDPTDIKSLGELKIPGFSRYLHPYDENTIIGIGRDATDLGQQQGLKISLFDVTDVENPKEIAKFVTKEQYSQSTAEYEHKAFLFDREKELLVIPAYSYDWDYRGNNRQRYNGAMVFRINRDEIVMRGIVDHSGNTENYWSAAVERSLWIEDLLYTKSPNLLRINEIDDLSSVKNITLKSKNSGPYAVY